MDTSFYVVAASVIPVLLLGTRVRALLGSEVYASRKEKRIQDQSYRRSRAITRGALWASPFVMGLALFGIADPNYLFKSENILSGVIGPLVVGVEIALLCALAAMDPLFRLDSPSDGEATEREQ